MMITMRTIMIMIRAPIPIQTPMVCDFVISKRISVFFYGVGIGVGVGVGVVDGMLTVSNRCICT
jgi:hypothetical protein